MKNDILENAIETEVENRVKEFKLNYENNSINLYKLLFV